LTFSSFTIVIENLEEQLHDNLPRYNYYSQYISLDENYKTHPIRVKKPLEFRYNLVRTKLQKK